MTFTRLEFGSLNESRTFDDTVIMRQVWSSNLFRFFSVVFNCKVRLVCENIKSFKKIIRAFIFKGTLPCIRHDTLIQRNEDGGINLHDIESKIKSFRLKYLYKVLESPEEYPLSCYFLSDSLSHIFAQNTYEFYDGEIPSFYESIKDIYLCHSNVFHLSNSTSIYYNLIQTKKQILNDQIKRADEGLDLSVIFKELHGNKYTSPTQKQIIYRLLFGITPTSEGLAKRHRRIFFCKFCNLEQETETHIFYSCPSIYSMKLNLIRLLRQPHNTFIDIYEGIFLNITPREENKELHLIKQAFLSIYRDTIWTARNQATHKNYIMSQVQMNTLFHNKVKSFLKRFKEDENIQLFYLF